MTEKKEGALESQRHSLAHLLAAAVLEIYPDSKPTIGPATDTGFYYDFDFGTTSLSEKDLPKIEKKMKELIKSWSTFDGKEVSKEEALEAFKDNEYKTELINEISEAGEKITFYTSGEFTDLCRGGHIDDMSAVAPDSFELDRIAGAYWRGSEENTMLTRIYGLAFENKEDLDAFKAQREEAALRDHRKLGKELDLFTFSDLIGPGLPLFTPKGTAMRNAIVSKIQGLQKEFGYDEVWIPHITKKELYETSGHWEKFGDELFKVTGKSDAEFVMKPMNCPHHTQIFASKLRSYKEMPVRYTEATAVYRDEQAGELLGLSRVRAITQDDGHVFCTPEQIEDEVNNIIQVIKDFYTDLGMLKDGNYFVSLSVRDAEKSDKYLGDDKKWNLAETALENTAKANNLPYKRIEGEAAFYGPKLDFMFKDALGREWQLATAQVDFVMPERFGLEYVDSEGKKQHPVMIHRAIAGSLERFMSVMIEHFAGNFPLWLAPTQVKVIPIGENHIEFAKEIHENLHTHGFRSELDDSNNGFGKKVRAAKDEKVPYFIIIGDKDLEAKKVTLESRDEGNLGQIDPSEIIEKLK